MNETALSPINTGITLSLDPEVQKNLQSYEDYISYYMTLQEASNSVAWIKADVLTDLLSKHGEVTLQSFAKEVNEAPSTVSAWVRTAKAFPFDKRVPHLSFTHHFQASFADKYDEDKGEFIGDKRFEWIDKAAVDNSSTRKLQAEIHEAKKVAAPQGMAPKCDLCHADSLDGRSYVFYAPNSGERATKLELHESCRQEILDFIKNYSK